MTCMANGKAKVWILNNKVVVCLENSSKGGKTDIPSNMGRVSIEVACFNVFEEFCEGEARLNKGG